MKKLILTHPKMQGEVLLVYGSELKLVLVDFQKAELNAKVLDWLWSRVHIDYSEQVKNNFADFQVLESSVEITFDMFFDKYNQRINKKRCEKIWEKLVEADKAKAYFGLWKYEKHLSANTWKNKADPENWLKKRMWENEYK
jgi:hypothetical protein